MKQGQKVTWIDGMGIEHEGVVDWEAIQWTANPIPIRTKDNIIRWIERQKVAEAHNG